MFLYLENDYKSDSSKIYVEGGVMGAIACDSCGKTISEDQVKHGDCQQCSLCEACVAAYIAKDCKDCKNQKG
jgi:hypothetical protein